MTARSKRRHTPSRTALPRWKKVLFGAVTVALFFAALEVLLALAGVKPVLHERDPFVGFAPLPLFVETAGDDGRPYMVTAQNKLAWFNRQQFPKHKTPGTLRVFCLGGSTTYGHPYDDTASFAAWLRELLPQALGRPCEVINAGGISYASYRVAALMQELAQYEPDLFIVYSGHNEFLEQRTYGDMQAASPARLWATALLARTRTFAAIDRLVNRPEPRPRTELANEVDAVLDHSVGPSSYHRDDKLHSQVLKHYAYNLGRMANLARAAGAELLLVTPASNVKDCSPFKSEHAAHLTQPQREQVTQQLTTAADCLREGRYEEALEACRAALAIDPRYADAHFCLGRALLALDRKVEAAEAFNRALDEDVCPVRAPTEIAQIVRREGQRWNVPVVDYVALLQNDCLRNHGHTVPGNEYFLDHVHPTLDATRLLGVAIARQLAASGLIDSSAAWTEEQIQEADRRIRSRLDANAHALALRTLAKVLNWAGKHEQAGPLAVQALQTMPDDPESLVLAAAYLKTTGQAQQAIEYYRRAIRHAPRYAEAHRLLGAALVEQGALEEALLPFERLTQLTPDDAHAWHMHAAVLAELGRHAEAVASYERAEAISPDEPHLQFNFGKSLAALGRSEDAARRFRRALNLNPHDDEARQALESLP